MLAKILVAYLLADDRLKNNLKKGHVFKSILFASINLIFTCPNLKCFIQLLLFDNQYTQPFQVWHQILCVRILLMYNLLLLLKSLLLCCVFSQGLRHNIKLHQKESLFRLLHGFRECFLYVTKCNFF